MLNPIYSNKSFLCDMTLTKLFSSDVTLVNEDHELGQYKTYVKLGEKCQRKSGLLWWMRIRPQVPASQAGT